MLTMMDSMGEVAQRFKNNSNWSLGSGFTPYSSPSGLSGYPYSAFGTPGAPWVGGVPLQSPVPGVGSLPLQPGFPQASPFAQIPHTLSPVDGIWLGRGGEIVLVMYGHFRIYASAEVYQDGRFEILGERLVMYDPQSERRMVFEYYLEDGRMILRNEVGDLLLFKQLPIPIPPYSLLGKPAATDK